MLVSQLINAKGNPASNQFVIDLGNRIIFQSYASLIVDINYSEYVITIGDDYNYSRTTGKHRNIFFEDFRLYEIANLKGLERALKDGHFESYGTTWNIKRGTITV